MSIFHFSIVSIEGVPVNQKCDKGDGTEGITGCLSSRLLKYNAFPDQTYQTAVCMKSSTLRSKGLKCKENPQTSVGITVWLFRIVSLKSANVTRKRI